MVKKEAQDLSNLIVSIAIEDLESRIDEIYGWVKNCKLLPSEFMRGIPDEYRLAMYPMRINNGFSNFFRGVFSSIHQLENPTDLMREMKSIEISGTNVYREFGDDFFMSDSISAKHNALKIRSVNTAVICINRIGDRLHKNEVVHKVNVDIFDYILSHGVDTNSLMGVQKMTPAHYLMHWNSFPKAQMQMLAVLAKHGADFSVENEAGFSVDDIMNGGPLAQEYAAMKVMSKIDSALLVPRKTKIRL